MTAGSVVAAVGGCGKTGALAVDLDGAAGDGAGAPGDGGAAGGDAGTDAAPANACVPVTSCVSPVCPPPDAGALNGCDWGCPIGPLCAPVAFQIPDTSSSGGGVDASWSVNDEAAARCALAAMRDGTKGRIDWSSEVVGGLGGGHRERMYIIDGRLVYSAFNDQGDSFSEGRFEGAQLSAGSYFDGCLEAGTASAYEGCFVGALLPCH